MTKYLSLHYLRSKWPFSPQSRKFNIFATTTKICDQTSHPERNHNWGLHCNQIPFPAFVLKIETFLEWLQFMPASNSGPAPYAYSPDCHLVVTCCRIVTASQRESSFYSRQSDVNHSLWFGQTQDIIGKITFSRHFALLPNVQHERHIYLVNWARCNGGSSQNISSNLCDSKVNLFAAGAVAFGAVGLGQDSSWET